VNDAVIPAFPVIANPTTILSSIPSNTAYFSVVDLCSAFFSIPIAQEVQFLFAFTYQGRQYTWTVLPQGYCESPTLFSRALKDDLDDVVFPCGSTLIQYVDDLLICSASKDACERDTLTLLGALARKGHKASRAKLQFCQEEVKYLGHILKGDTRRISPERIAAILNLPKPTTAKQMRSFLGVTGYCRQWIPDYAALVRPLVDIGSANAPSPLAWTQNADKAFVTLKQALSSAPALGLPNYEKPFHLYACERQGFAQSVLTQKHGNKLRPVAYYSTKLDPVAQGFPSCLKAVAAASLAVQATEALVAGNTLILLVPHAVTAVLLKTKTQHLSASRATTYELSLTAPTNITIRRCAPLNPASLLPGVQDGDPHNCEEIIAHTCLPRPDLRDTPIQNSELILYVDGSSSRASDGYLLTGYAVCSDHELIESGRLAESCSAQQAELFALTRACHLAKGQIVTIYTDSSYAFGAVHEFGALWRERGFITSSGTRVRNGAWIANLLEAILLPHQIAVVKCDAHTGRSDDVSRGNARADVAAKSAAHTRALLTSQCVLRQEATPTIDDVNTLQTAVSARERDLWILAGCEFENESKLWRSSDGRVVAPRALLPWLARLAHGAGHTSKGGMSASIGRQWRGSSNSIRTFCSYPDGFCSVAKMLRFRICFSHRRFVHQVG